MPDSSDLRISPEEARTEFVKMCAQSLCAAVSRRYDEAIGEMCGRLTKGYSIDILKVAFGKAEILFDRFTEFNKLREYCDVAVSDSRLHPRESNEHCSLCLGTGWKMIQKPHASNENYWAVKCDCRKAGVPL